MGAVTRQAVLSGLAASAALVAACSPGPPPGVVMRDGSLRSGHWPGKEIRWRLALPDRAATPPPTVVVLHGRDGTADAAFDDKRMQDHVARTGLAVASVDGGNHWWHARRSGIDTGAMVREDFLPLVADQTGYAGRLALAASILIAVAAWLSNRTALKEAIKVRHVLAMAGAIALVPLPLGLWAGMSVLAWALLIFLGAFASVAVVVGTSRPSRR